MSWQIIKSETEYYAALDRLELIFQSTSDDATSDEFDLLTMLINKYEQDNFKIPESDPIAVIKMKMDYMGLKQKDLVSVIGSKSTVSKILTYKAALTLRHIRLFSEFLGLSIGILAKPYSVIGRSTRLSNPDLVY